MDVEGECDIRAWDELVPDALVLIFKNLNLQEVLQVVPRVCKSWYKVVEGPYCWRMIDIDDWRFRYPSSLKKVDQMLRTLILRSSGSLRELNVSSITDDQMLFIAEHAGSLETLKIRRSSISDSMFEKVASKLSSLTTLDLSYGYKISARALEVIGTNCKTLSSLTCNVIPVWSPESDNSRPCTSDADMGRAIARTMPKLKHLNIAYVNIDTDVALEILSGCPELESLNIKGCWGVNFGRSFLEEKYPKINAVLVDAEDSNDDYGWDTRSSALWLWMIQAYKL